jgi:hypothetical protein
MSTWLGKRSLGPGWAPGQNNDMNTALLNVRKIRKQRFPLVRVSTGMGIPFSLLFLLKERGTHRYSRYSNPKRRFPNGL